MKTNILKKGIYSQLDFYENIKIALQEFKEQAINDNEYFTKIYLKEYHIDFFKFYQFFAEKIKNELAETTFTNNEVRNITINNLNSILSEMRQKQFRKDFKWFAEQAIKKYERDDRENLLNNKKVREKTINFFVDNHRLFNEYFLFDDNRKTYYSTFEDFLKKASYNFLEFDYVKEQDINEFMKVISFDMEKFKAFHKEICEKIKKKGEKEEIEKIELPF